MTCLSQIFRPGTVINAYTNFHLHLTLVRRTSENNCGFIGEQQMTQALEEMKISVKIHLIWLMHHYICVGYVIYCLGVAYLAVASTHLLYFHPQVGQTGPEVCTCVLYRQVCTSWQQFEYYVYKYQGGSFYRQFPLNQSNRHSIYVTM